jgi:beta-lactamase regulating signal transducer with metallopeptidase domain
VRPPGAPSPPFCNLRHVVPEVWEIVLLVWIVVIPATVALLTALAARRRAARARQSFYDATDQPGQLLRLAVHTRRVDRMRAVDRAG